MNLNLIVLLTMHWHKCIIDKSYPLNLNGIYIMQGIVDFQIMYLISIELTLYPLYINWYYAIVDIFPLIDDEK